MTREFGGGGGGGGGGGTSKLVNEEQGEHSINTS